MKHIFMGRVLIEQELFVHTSKHCFGWQIMHNESEVEAFIRDNLSRDHKETALIRKHTEFKDWEIISTSELITQPILPIHKHVQIGDDTFELHDAIPLDTGEIVCHVEKIVRTDIDIESIQLAARLKKYYDENWELSLIRYNEKLKNQSEIKKPIKMGVWKTIKYWLGWD